MVVCKSCRIIFILIFLISFVWIIIYQTPDSYVHLITCDVGQGDATLLTYKSFQILTDGGPPNGKIERCLSRHIPFWDRKIEVVVNTHPQLDHFGGLINIFKNYKIDRFIFNDIESISTPEIKALRNAVGSNAVKVIKAVTGVSIGYDLISYDIFYPTEAVVEEVKTDSKRDPNDISVQSHVKVGNFEAILTGDIGENVSDEVLNQFNNLSVKQSLDYIKIPHHGSKNSMLGIYLREFVPKIAVISVGKNNSFGHPHQEVIKILRDKDIKILRTDEIGDIEIVTNGKEFWVEN